MNNAWQSDLFLCRQNQLNLERMSFKQGTEIPTPRSYGHGQAYAPRKIQKEKQKWGVQKETTQFLPTPQGIYIRLGRNLGPKLTEKRHQTYFYLKQVSFTLLPHPGNHSGILKHKKYSEGWREIVAIYLLPTEIKDYILASKGSVFFGFISTPIETISFPNNFSQSQRQWVML